MPVYYITQSSDDDRRSGVAGKSSHISIPLGIGSYSHLAGWFRGMFDKLRGRSRVADGWQAVATDGEGDETVELHQNRR